MINSNSFGIQTFTHCAGRIQNMTLREAVRELDEFCIGNLNSVVVFSNGISEYSLKRLIALRHLKVQDFDWKKAKRFKATYEDGVVGWEIDKYLRETDFDNILVISDSFWVRHPVSEELSKVILGANTLIEIRRPRQTWLDCIARAVDERASVHDMISLLETFQADYAGEQYEPFCEEYQYLDVAFRALLNDEMIEAFDDGLISEDTWDFMIHRVLGLTCDIPIRVVA